MEELARIHSVNAQNILRLSSFIRYREIEAADKSLEALRKQEIAVKNRIDYYHTLITVGLNKEEKETLDLLKSAVAFGVSAEIAMLTSSILEIAAHPNIFGSASDTGLEISPNVFEKVSRWLHLVTRTIQLSSSLTQNLGANERRLQGWKFQKSSAEDDLAQVQEQIQAAEARLAIANHSLTIHEENIRQQEEIYEFLQSKFSNLGLYTWMSSNLQKLYREAYNNALKMAKMAERAYRFERGDDTTPLLSGNYWDAEYGGLLAGQKLLMDLQKMEQSFIETNYRRLEIDQAFSLTQVAPAALIRLKETGECEFAIPELYLDLFYPGHYKRRIRSARLTIPCITGPYTNVGATLTLTGSRLRLKPNLEDGPKEVPPTRTTTIATSTAQNDSGVFEFNFRDERYMPFEGAGAISDWRLSLPKSFRPFDYNTINDVILHISYEADYDEVFAAKVGSEIEMVVGSIQEVLKNQGLVRLFSLRQEFSNAFSRLLHSGDEVTIEILDKHFPIFLQGKKLMPMVAKIVLDVPKEQKKGGLKLTVDDQKFICLAEGEAPPAPEDLDAEHFSIDGSMGELYFANLKGVIDRKRTPTGEPSGIVGKYALSIQAAGDLAPDEEAHCGTSVIDEEKLTDIYLYLEYTME